MKEITVIAPIKTPDNIKEFTKKVKCREFFVYYHRLADNFELIKEYIKIAHENSSKLYINFKHSLLEEDLANVKKFITYLTKTDIDGIFVNSYSVLEIIKSMDLPFDVVIDSYFDIHNLAGIDFMEMFHKITRLIITEEIYLKNIEKIKKYSKLPLSVDSDNLPWFADDLVNSKAIQSVVIKGRFETSDDILEGIKLVEKILTKPKLFKEQKLPFKHIRKCFYKTNHFSGEVYSAEGEDFKFANNIQKYDWKIEEIKLSENVDFSKIKLPKLNLRLASLVQLKEIDKLIKKLGFCPISSIEYGEVASTVDLYSKSFYEIIKTVKKFCKKHGIALNLSTPRILIERDFDRVFELIKQLALENPRPNRVVINNIGFWWNFINDDSLTEIPIEIGGGINLLNSMAIKCLNNLNQITAIDFSTLNDEENILKCLKKVKKIIPVRKIFIAGAKRVESQGLCPLNCDSAVISRLVCSAPCHKGHFALNDPSLEKKFPFMVDGFCKMHMFEDGIVQDWDKIEFYEANGINEFILDLSAIHSAVVPKIICNYLNHFVK
ncbi:U32 family peptidase [bacterium]|nr:U32 family peptidase [bacterium]